MPASAGGSAPAAASTKSMTLTGMRRVWESPDAVSVPVMKTEPLAAVDALVLIESTTGRETLELRVAVAEPIWQEIPASALHDRLTVPAYASCELMLTVVSIVP